jgi:F0F1-type ATP synthase membrane subunit a
MFNKRFILFVFLLNLLILNSIKANKTELWESSLADLKEEFNYQLGVYVKVYDLKIQELTKQFSGNF